MNYVEQNWRPIAIVAFIFGMPWVFAISHAIGFGPPGLIIVVGLWALLLSISAAPWFGFQLLSEADRLGGRFALVLALATAYGLSTAGAFFVGANYSGWVGGLSTTRVISFRGPAGRCSRASPIPLDEVAHREPDPAALARTVRLQRRRR